MRDRTVFFCSLDSLAEYLQKLLQFSCCWCSLFGNCFQQKLITICRSYEFSVVVVAVVVLFDDDGRCVVPVQYGSSNCNYNGNCIPSQIIASNIARIWILIEGLYSMSSDLQTYIFINSKGYLFRKVQEISELPIQLQWSIL